MDAFVVDPAIVKLDVVLPLIDPEVREMSPFKAKLFPFKSNSPAVNVNVPEMIVVPESDLATPNYFYREGDCVPEVKFK